MDPLGKNSKCPKCNERLKSRRVLGATDTPVWACMPCGLYGVDGDDRVFDRVELGDAVLEERLIKRAAKLVQDVAAAQGRYTDAPKGKIWS